MTETWKTIEEYPEYEVSNYGNVRSIDRFFIDSLGRKYYKKGKILKLKIQKDNKYPYQQVMVCIWSNKKMHRLIVARLVAKAFIPNPQNLPQVNHIDENSLNNRSDNLEWCTCKYNVNYGNSIKKRSKNKCRSIDVYDSELNFIETLSSAIEVSKKYNISRSMISQCCNGYFKFAKGYHLEFHE